MPPTNNATRGENHRIHKKKPAGQSTKDTLKKSTFQKKNKPKPQVAKSNSKNDTHLTTPPQPPEDTTLQTDQASIPIQDDQHDSSKNDTSNRPESKNIIIPPHLLKSYDITTMSIISSSQIQTKVTRALSLLSTYPTPPSAKPVLILLHAKSKAAAKLISIAEIVKREIAGKEGGKWFQYNVVEQVVEEQKEVVGKGEEKKVSGEEKGEDVEMGNGDIDAESEEEGFEVMKTPFERTLEGTAKVRSVPVMRIYLSRVRIESLRREYG